MRCWYDIRNCTEVGTVICKLNMNSLFAFLWYASFYPQLRVNLGYRVKVEVAFGLPQQLKSQIPLKMV